jgi:serine/threonine protein kinase
MGMNEESEEDRGPEQRANARLGCVLREKWRLEKLLGIGGMAAVYEASHRNGSRAAIKILHLEYSRDGEAKRRFLREGYIANSVGHPGAVRIIDDDVAEDGSAFVVMELLEGETLDARARRQGGTLPPEELVGIADSLLDILASAHEKGVIHRDIKPDNVFVTREGAVRLLDFGIARMNSAQPGSLATVNGTMFGTPAFMPPEQALGRNAEVDARSDLWAVGGVMFALLSGRLMHIGESLNEQLVLNASLAAAPLDTVAPSVPKPIQAVVDRALAFQKAKRWPDARAMQLALRAAQRALGWPVSISAPLPASPANAPALSASPNVPVAGPPLASIALAGTAHGISQGLTPSPKGRFRPGLVAVGILAFGLVAVGIGFGRRGGEHRAPGAVDGAAATTTSPLASALPIVASVVSPSSPTVRVEAAGSPTGSAEVAGNPTGSAEAANSRSPSAAVTSRPSAGAQAKAALPPKPSSTASAAPDVPVPPDDWLTRQH